MRGLERGQGEVSRSRWEKCSGSMVHYQCVLVSALIQFHLSSYIPPLVALYESMCRYNGKERVQRWETCRVTTRLPLFFQFPSLLPPEANSSGFNPALNRAS